MNVRFAEPCRANPMDFEGAEWDVLGASVRDGGSMPFCVERPCLISLMPG